MQRLINNLTITVTLLLALTACSRPGVPTSATPEGRQPILQPDYCDVTIPPNICPLNFGLNEGCDRVVARVTSPHLSFTYGKGQQVEIDEEEWRQLLADARGDRLTVETWGRRGNQWMQFEPFTLTVAEEEIDPYISYRLIPPSYVSYEELIIEQRSLTSFETSEIYNNMKLTTEQKGQCINCHSYQNYGTDRMLFHVRKDWGGTLLVNGGEVKKIDLKTPETLSAGVYPAWHPTEQLIAFSTNKTAQVFHTSDCAKVEVFDEKSDLILYDVARNEVRPIATTDSLLECFPTWSPDGRWLYFCSARIPFDIHADDPSLDAISHYQEVRYDLCRKSFDARSLTFGPTEMVYEASADSLSVTLPRLSPDGRWIVFAEARWGCFHVWHPEADIMAIDLSTGAKVSLTGLNSEYSESYPSFSSNGRWVMTASRRDDNNYTRPYIAYFDDEGHCAKAFELPQRTAAFYALSLKSFNRPEFMREPVRVTCNEFAKVSRDTEAIKARFVASE